MDWVRYWRADGLAVEAMHAHLTSHVYHRHSHETYSFGVTETGAQAFTCRNGRHVSAAGMVMTFNPDDPHDGHAATADGFTYWMAHVSPSVFGTRPLFREPVLTDPVLAGAVRGLCVALAGPAGALERYERLTTATRLLTARAGGRSRSPARLSPTGSGRCCTTGRPKTSRRRTWPRQPGAAGSPPTARSP